MKRFITIVMSLVLLVAFANANNQDLVPVKIKKSSVSIKKPNATIDDYIDHTFGRDAEYYLGSGLENDTFAVYYKPQGTGVIVKTIEHQWFDGDGTLSNYVFLWNAGPDVPPSGLANDYWDANGDGQPGDTVVALLGGIATSDGGAPVGPIPNTPAAGYDYQGPDLEALGAETTFGDATTPVAFFAGFVKLGEAPHPLASNTRNYLGGDQTYTWAKGPTLRRNDIWSPYNSYIELQSRVGVTYLGDPPPAVTGFTQLPNTYDGTQDFVIEATAKDNNPLPTDGATLLYSVNGGDQMTMPMTYVGTVDNIATYTATLSGLNLGVGDYVMYNVQVTDDNSATSQGLAKYFEVIEAANPDANILLVDDGMANPALMALKTVLENMGQSVEVYETAANNGWDKSITTYTGNSGTIYDAIIIHGFGTSTVPTRAYTADHPVAAYLDMGGNLLYEDQDYFYTNGEGNEPVFAQGDFAYDYFSIEGGVNDPGSAAYVNVYGDDILMDLTAATFNADEMSLWPDLITPLDATPILLVDSNDPNFPDETVGAYYTDGNFTTALFVGPIHSLNTTTASGDSVIVSPEFETIYLGVLTGAFGLTATSVGENDGLVKEFRLENNYPNPFNPTTNIQYTIPFASHVELTIYNLMGQKVKTLVNEVQTANTYTVQWDATDASGNVVPSGVYYYQIKSENFQMTKKMLLVK